MTNWLDRLRLRWRIRQSDRRQALIQAQERRYLALVPPEPEAEKPE
jgi:hypothetical protein